MQRGRTPDAPSQRSHPVTRQEVMAPHSTVIPGRHDGPYSGELPHEAPRGFLWRRSKRESEALPSASLHRTYVGVDNRGKPGVSRGCQVSCKISSTPHFFRSAIRPLENEHLHAIDVRGADRPNRDTLGSWRREKEREGDDRDDARDGDNPPFP